MNLLPGLKNFSTSTKFLALLVLLPIFFFASTIVFSSLGQQSPQVSEDKKPDKESVNTKPKAKGVKMNPELTETPESSPPKKHFSSLPKPDPSSLKRDNKTSTTDDLIGSESETELVLEISPTRKKYFELIQEQTKHMQLIAAQAEGDQHKYLELKQQWELDNQDFLLDIAKYKTSLLEERASYNAQLKQTLENE
jgi:hypothetical protein